MQYSILAILAAATAVVASPQGWGPGPQILSGGQCEPDGLNHCLNDNQAWGCVQLAGPNFVDQTKQCDNQCLSNGFRYAYQKLTVADVGGEVVGPAEARRYLGEEIADAATLGGPVVLVSARLPSLTFEAEGKTRRYHDGMWGKAEVRVRSEPILVALIPALKALFENRG